MDDKNIFTPKIPDVPHEAAPSLPDTSKDPLLSDNPSSSSIPQTPVVNQSPENFQPVREERSYYQSPVVSPSPSEPHVSQANTPPSGPPPPPSLTPASFFKNSFWKIGLGIVALGLFLFLVFGVFLPFLAARSKPKPVTLTYWGLWEDSSVMDKIFADFNRQYPYITVKYQRQDPKDYRKRLVTRIQNGNGPDIFRFHNSWLPMLAGNIAPLPESVITPSEFQSFFYPVVKTDLVKNGAIYGIPLEIDTLAMFTNDEIFRSAGLTPPGTWEDFVKDAKALTVKDATGKIKTAGAAIGTFDNVNHAPDLISLLFSINGVDLLNMGKDPKKVSDALGFYTAFAKDQGNVWDDTLDPSILAFAKGNVGMVFGYSWDVLAIKAANPTLSFSISPMPSLAEKKMTVASYWAEGVSSKTGHPKEAFLLLHYLAQKDTAIKFYTETAKRRLFGEPYARQDLASSLRDNKLVYPFLKQAPYALSTFFASSTYDDGLNAQMNVYLGNAVRSLYVNTSPESASDTLIKGVSQVLTQYGK